MPAFLAAPDDAAKAPAVIVVHERYGLVRHTCDLAERFARDGFVAIAPDLYFKHPDQHALHRGDAGCDVSDPDALIALRSAIGALNAVPQVGSVATRNHGHLPDRPASARGRGIAPDLRGARLVRRSPAARMGGQQQVPSPAR